MIRGENTKKLRFQYRVGRRERQPPFLDKRSFPMVQKNSPGNLTVA